MTSVIGVNNLNIGIAGGGYESAISKIGGATVAGWTPASTIESVSPLLWMKATAGVNGGSPANNDPVSAWVSQEGNSYNFAQAVGGQQPTWLATGINGRPAINFVPASSQILKCTSAFLTGTVGTAVIIYQLTSKAGVIKTLLASCFDGANTTYIILEGASANASGKIEYQVENVTSPAIIQGNTNMATGVPLCGVWQSDAAAINIRLSGSAQTLSVTSGSNTGAWWDSVVLKNNTTIGGYNLLAQGNFHNGLIAEILIYPIKLSAASLTKLSYYTQGLYGVNT